MGSETKNTGVFRWKGMMADSDAILRRFAACALALACVTPVITQWGYVGVQFADGTVAYLMFMLLPVALAALLLGTLPGVAAGFLGGAALYLHACLMPVDYYEIAYVNPVTSVVATTLSGLAFGVLFALALNHNGPLWRRALLLVLACLAASCVFSGVCALGYGWSASVGEIALEGIAFQAVGDAIIWAIVSVAGMVVVEKAGGRANVAGLRDQFGARLLAVVLVGFAIVAMAAYGAVTAGELNDARNEMQDETSYLLGQVLRTAEYNGKVYEAFLEAGDGSSEPLEMLDELTSGGLLSSILSGYAEEKDGLIIVSLHGLVVGTDADRIAVESVDELDGAVGSDVLAAADRSVRNGTLERVVYLAPSAFNDLVDLAPSGGSDGFSSMLTPQVGYLVAVESDGYRVTAIRPSSMVFAARNDIAGWVTFASAVLLVFVSVLMWWLLNKMVTRRIHAANAALARITDGDLDARVEPEGALEFVELSDGINHTVDALQGWIAEAETRMDAELTTAKAIQESALPQVFPPYPDILKFDIYASMNAAKEVGGDFYDFFLIGDSNADAGRLGFVMADVSGKGVPAALFMMKAKTLIRDYLEEGTELGEAIENVNRQLVDGNDAGMFVTAWVGVLDYANGRVNFVNAGHNPPLLWQSEGDGQEGAVRAGSWRWLSALSGMPLGLFDGFPYEVYSVECMPGDTFLLYTDGVTEAMSVNDELYGEDRLEALANENIAAHPRELVQSVRAGVAEHAAGAEQSDDITILALEVGVPPEEKAVLAVPADIDELDRVYEFIHGELDRRLCPKRVQNQLDIAVEELFVNVCRYAYEGMPADVERTARVTYAISKEPPSITVEIIDGGVPFDPLAEPDASTADEFDSVDDAPIGGLGILMVKKSVNEMSYERTDGCNVVTLVKRW